MIPPDKTLTWRLDTVPESRRGMATTWPHAPFLSLPSTLCTPWLPGVGGAAPNLGHFSLSTEGLMTQEGLPVRGS
uniref:Unnamed protein product n=1 Tax=Macaca fascicularis TaxID=9541 RepID=Q9N068_MACFA|nr:unnamed protein product [Macaca fascicularis]